uniref:Probable glutamine--tRNA ligase n=1 Tax=Lutzomyia longipalpis TaxID=7200 RepID=A0A1B0CGP3_LUTLO
MASEELLKQFVGLGMTEQKAKETLKNANVTKNLTEALKSVDPGSLPDGAGMLLYHMASKVKPQIVTHIPFLADYIKSQKLDTIPRVDAALEFLLTHGAKGSAVNVKDFDKACGVGVVVTPEEIDRTVEGVIKKNLPAIQEQRYRFNVGKIMQEVRTALPWADGKAVKSEVEVQIFDLLGPKTEADLAPAPKVEKKPKKVESEVKLPSADSGAICGDGASNIAELMRTKVHFHAPGENYKTDGYVVTPLTDKLLQEHLKATGGKVRTRFPPEPNGILHIGHAKAININFGYAQAHGGTCYLRYDDTNPEKEEEKFFVGIRDMVEWLGYTPAKITHSSDNFQQLYEWAVQLIRKGMAYVCHQKSEEMKGFNPIPSPWRDRPIEESLLLFEDMRNGKIAEGEATLRMRITLEEGKMDPVAYRIKFIPHPRTSDWCIYPTYDFTHCLCDSLENITHSLCTKEFQSRRSSYYWLCNALDIYCPVQWEYGRLNVNYTVVSKRKIARLITEKIVQDWDDPRLFTLTALRRRGFPPEAINNFCAQMGVTGAQGSVDPAMLDASVRDFLNSTAPRTLVVLEPLKVTLKDFPHTAPVTISVPNFPGNPEKGSHSITLDRVIFIERSDFKETPEKGYRRLSPTQSVGLRHAGLIISVSEILRDASGAVQELICSCHAVEGAEKPKAFIQFVSQPLPIEVRLYEPLFRHKNPEDPAEVPGGFLSDCNPDSRTIVHALADKHLAGAKVYVKFQFERIGFFSVDPDTTPGKLVFNRTVTLKEDAGKKMAGNEEVEYNVNDPEDDYVFQADELINKLQELRGKSEDNHVAMLTVYKRLQSLGVELKETGINFDYEDKKDEFERIYSEYLTEVEKNRQLTKVIEANHEILTELNEELAQLEVSAEKALESEAEEEDDDQEAEEAEMEDVDKLEEASEEEIEVPELLGEEDDSEEENEASEKGNEGSNEDNEASDDDLKVQDPKDEEMKTSEGEMKTSEEEMEYSEAEAQQEAIESRVEELKTSEEEIPTSQGEAESSEEGSIQQDAKNKQTEDLMFTETED